MSEKKKNILFAIVAIVLGFLFVEGGVRLVEYFRGPTDPRLSFTSLKGKPWAVELTYESNQALIPYQRLEPYVMWEVKDFHGTYMNVDSEGRRATWEPSTTEQNVPGLYMFGGSTMYGAGARDDYTIASALSKLVNQPKPQALISNYGQPAYRFDQELIKLVTLLESGDRPTYVVFYDGANDINITYDMGTAEGLEETELVARADYNDVQSFVDSTKEVIKDYCESCTVLVRGVKDILKINPHPSASTAFTHAQIETLADNLFTHYTARLALLDQLSQYYHFRYAVFWQPELLTGETLVGDEKQLPAIDFRLDDPQNAEFYQAVDARIQTIKSKNFFDITDALAGRTTQVYTDDVHISEEGNQMVAQKMFNILHQSYGL